jgi:hypothetical protein
MWMRGEVEAKWGEHIPKRCKKLNSLGNCFEGITNHKLLSYLECFFHE